MPLRETVLGKECPLGKWQIDNPAAGGRLTKDLL